MFHTHWFLEFDDGKGQFSFQPQRRAVPKMFKLPHNCTHASKLMLKILKLTISRTWTEEFQMYKLDLENTEEPEIKLATFIGLYRKQENSRKTCASLTLWKPLTVWITTNWKILKEMGIPDHLNSPKKSVWRSRRNRIWHGTMDWFKIGKEYDKTLYCHSAYLTRPR